MTDGTEGTDTEGTTTLREHFDADPNIVDYKRIGQFLVYDGLRPTASKVFGPLAGIRRVTLDRKPLKLARDYPSKGRQTNRFVALCIMPVGRSRRLCRGFAPLGDGGAQWVPTFAAGATLDDVHEQLCHACVQRADLKLREDDIEILKSMSKEELLCDNAKIRSMWRLPEEGPNGGPNGSNGPDAGPNGPLTAVPTSEFPLGRLRVDAFPYGKEEVDLFRQASRDSKRRCRGRS